MSWFNALDHNPELGGGASLPVGKYPVQITGSTVRATNDQSGGILVFTCAILDGPNRGNSGNLLLNLWNKSDQTKEIAGRHLSAICYALNTHQLVAKPEGVELWNKPFVIEMAQQRNKDGEPTRYVELVGVFDMQGNAPKRGQAPAGPAAQPPQQFTGQQAPQFNQPAQTAQQAPAPAGQPSWGGQQQPNPPAAQPNPGQPSWGAQPINQAPQASPQAAPQGGQPSWSQQPPAGNAGQPSWAGPR